MKNRKGLGYVSPSDLGDLQVVFDALIAKHNVARESAQADNLASEILIGHGSGITGHEELMRHTEIPLGLKPYASCGKERPRPAREQAP